MFGKIVIVALLAVLAWGVVAHTSQGSGGEHVYVVRPADTLWTIAEARYGGDPRAGVWKLQRANHLRENMLQPGEKLLIP